MVKNDGEYIKREDVVRAIMSLPNRENGFSDTYDKETIIGVLEGVPSAQMWVHVNNRLPDNNMWCLVICNEHGGQITRVSLFYRDEFFEGDGKDITRFVTHWMPLPEPLKDGERW